MYTIYVNYKIGSGFVQYTVQCTVQYIVQLTVERKRKELFYAGKKV